MKAVFDTKPTSAYDDEVSQHYQFPRRYMAAVLATLGDWVILRRPRADGGNLAYFATARISAIEAHPQMPELTYARFADYLPFDEQVSWLSDGRYAEEALRGIPRREVGVYLRGRSVRPLSDEDFTAIILSGLKKTLDVTTAAELGILPGQWVLPGDALPAERVRQVEYLLTSRIVRDAKFRSAVSRAYDDTCSVTRLQIYDSAGNPEIQAAHIWGVAEGGPDVVQNGIALSATVHWLFDRYLISISDTYEILIDEERVPALYKASLLKHAGKLYLPADQKAWPHPIYLAKHRQKFFAVRSVNDPSFLTGQI